MFKFILSTVVITVMCAMFAQAQQPQTNAVPFISGITPPSLPLTSNGGYGSATLTINGANFPQNAVVNLSFGTSAIHPSTTTVNASGSQITAQFSGNLPLSPLAFNVTVTNPNGTLATVSNVVYLPQTPTTSTVLLNQDNIVPGPSFPSAVAVADMQANGLPSLAITSQTMDTLTTELNNFNGFQTGSAVSVGVQPYGIATGEFLRGDNLPEFVVTNSEDNTITLLVANGTNGSYRQFTSTPVPGFYPTGIVAGDFNRDGIMDLAVVSTCSTRQCYPVATPQSPGFVTIFLGDGMGGFTASPSQLTTGNIPYAIAAADLNGDGILDLVVANSGSNSLSIFVGNEDGTFTQTSASPATGNGPKAIAIGDFNGDGFLDIAVANSNDNTVSILLNQNCSAVAATACSFVPTATSPAVGNGPRAIATADMNADGFLDLIVANNSDGSVSVLLGDGTGAFTPVVPAPNYPAFTTGGGPVGVVLADFNQDGRLDIVTVDQNGSSYTLMRQAAVALLQLTTNLPTVTYGQVPTLSVQFQPGPAPAGPTGTVALFDGATKITSATLSGSQYQLQFVLPPAYFFGAGAHQLTAAYNGDSNFAPATSNAVTETVAQSSTTLTLGSNVTSAPYGAGVTLTATIQPQFPAPTTGTVTFLDASNSTTIGTATIANNSAQITVSNLSAGSHSIVATYQGDANCAGSSSSPVTETVTMGSTTTTVAATANPAGYGQAVTLTATVQPPAGTLPTGTVSFLDGSTTLGTATLANNTAQLSASSLSVGTHSLTAVYAGDGNLNGSTSTAVSETINQASTSTTVTASPNPTTFNQPISFVITITPAAGGTPSGTVTLLDGTNTLATATLFNGGPAHITFSGMAPGAHSISAAYSGDTNFSGSTSSAVTETINQASSTTTVSTSLNPSTFGQAVTLTSNVQAPQGITPTGTVTFLDGTATIGTASLSSGTAQLTLSGLASGAHNITASYAGNTYLTGSTSSALTQTVNVATSGTTLAASADPATYNQNVVFTATIQPQFGGSATGTITFLDGATTLGTSPVSGNAAQLSTSSLAVGPHSITARYNGDSNFAGSVSSAVAETINQGATTSVVTALTNPAAYGQAISFSVRVQSTASGTATGTVTLLDGTTTIGSTALPSNGTAQFTVNSLTIGSHSISATYAGDANFAGSTSATVTETVNRASTTTTVTSGTNPSAFSQSVTFTVQVQPSSGSTPTGTVTLLDGTTSIGSATLPASGTVQFPTSNLSTGTHSITATYGGDGNFSGSTSSGLAQTVNQAGTNTALSASVNPSTYGQAVTFTATVGTTGGGSPTGTVTFFDGGTQIGSGTVSGGIARLTTAATGLNAGSHMVTASYGGDVSFAGSNSTGWNQTVNAAATTTTLASNLNPSTLGQTVTFTATVTSSVSGTQSGTVSFYLDGSSTPVQTTALSGGAAQFSTSGLSGGSHTVVATFSSSNGNFLGSSSAALTQNVKDFSVSDSPTSLTVARRDSGTTTLTVAPIAGFTGTVSLSCSGAPANTSCSLSATQVTLNGGAANVTLTIHVNQKASPGNYAVTLQGVSGAISHTTSVALTIQ